MGFSAFNIAIFMKTKLLFVIESLICGGAEKSLTTLLNLIDYDQYDVSLQLFTHKGEFMKYIPKQVHLLPLLPSSTVESMSLPKQILTGRFKAAWAHVKFSYQVRQKSCVNNNDIFTRYWNAYGSLMTANPNEYDVSIAYGQRLPTFYVAQKVNAMKKFAWVNIIPQLNETNRQFQKPIYNCFDKVVCVSEASRQKSMELFELPLERTHIVTDIVDPDMIDRLADEEPEYNLDLSRPMILTVARLDYTCKGYDISLEAAKILRDRGVNFVWYALGKGVCYAQMKQYIAENCLEDHFILLGTTPNPYPYFKRCTIYAQTSRYEGYGISIAEARLLNRPVVCTEFGSVWKQMVQGENGLVTPIDATAVADAIQQLLANKTLYSHIQQYQMQEKKGNVEEMENITMLYNL